MKKIHNPYRELGNHNCFACTKHGLNMEFYYDNDYIISNWQADIKYSGFNGIVHGGIIATLMDEVAAWTILIKCQTSGVTTNCQINYKKGLSIPGNYLIRGHIIDQRKNIVNVETEILSTNQILITGVYKFFLFSKEEAMAKYNYPDFSKFLL